MKRLPLLITATLLACAWTLSHAQSDFYRRPVPTGVTEGGVVGMALLAGKSYQGSDESRYRALPAIDYQWSNGFFAGVLNGVGYNASSTPFMAYGLRITADFGRKERGQALQGMGDIDPRALPGAFFNVSPTRTTTLSSSLRYGSGNEGKGALLDLGAGWSTPLSPELRVGVNLATTWANKEAMAAYFGVSGEQAARSGYATYSPAAGLRDVRVGTSVVYRLTPEWSLTGTVGYSELLGDARRSPIVRDRASTSYVLALGYSF